MILGAQFTNRFSAAHSLFRIVPAAQMHLGQNAAGHSAFLFVSGDSRFNPSGLLSAAGICPLAH